MSVLHKVCTSTTTTTRLYTAGSIPARDAGRAMLTVPVGLPFDCALSANGSVVSIRIVSIAAIEFFSLPVGPGRFRNADPRPFPNRLVQPTVLNYRRLRIRWFPPKCAADRV